mgnify:CR=1 FL=1|jgi:hypothetical protein|tara:strand:+ start:1580 stop:1945 length:366 start_codon:yes stop_codon:yes gene_type:complete
MPAKRTQAFTVTGSTNSQVLDTGIESTVAENIHLLGVYVSVSAYQGNELVGWISQTRYLQIEDYIIRTHTASGTDQYPVTTARDYIEVDVQLDIGQKFQIGINSGGTASDLYGAYLFMVTN